MSETRPLTDHNFETELNNINNCFGDELVGNSALLMALEVVVLRNIPRLLIPIFEPLVRRVVKEEIELAQQRFSSCTNQNSDERAISPQLRKLKLRFRNKLSLPILTGKPILGENDSALELELIDENTGSVVKFGPESSASVEIVVHRLNQNIMGEGENANSLLIGNIYLNLSEGTGSVGMIYFTHGKNWTRKGDFMLGARFLNNYDEITVTEAKSEHFTLVDCRNKLYDKHYPPVLTDPVWRLEKIRKRGKFDKRLDGEKIKTVKDFLIQYFFNRQRLQDVLKMPDKLFSATVQHALTCKRYKHIYRPSNTQGNTHVVFDTVGQLLGVLSNNEFVSVDKLPEYSKVDAQKFVVSAFENWGDVVHYNETGTSLPSTSTNCVLPNYPLYSPTLDIPSPYLGSPHHVSSLQTHTNSNLGDLDFPENIGVHDGLQPIICQYMGTMTPNNAFTYTTTTTTSAVDLDFLDDLQPADMEFLRECLKSPLHIPELVVQGFGNDNIFDYSTLVEDYNNKDRRAWVRRWLKMVLVVRFFLRARRMEKTGHVRKRMRN